MHPMQDEMRCIRFGNLGRICQLKPKGLTLLTFSTLSFFYTMALRFPEANLIFLSNEMNAAVVKGNRDWNWRDE
jgi:hypothetical protein